MSWAKALLGASPFGLRPQPPRVWGRGGRGGWGRSRPYRQSPPESASGSPRRGGPAETLGVIPLLRKRSRTQGRGLAQERLVTCLRIAFRRSGTDPESPQTRPEHDAFLQVMSEEPVPRRERRRWPGTRSGRLVADPPCAVVRPDHFYIIGFAIGPGRCEQPRRERVRRRWRDRKCRQALKRAARLPAIIAQCGGIDVSGLDQAFTRFVDVDAPLAAHSHLDPLDDAGRRGVNLDLQIDAIHGARRPCGANSQAVPIGGDESRIKASPMLCNTDEACAVERRSSHSADRRDRAIARGLAWGGLPARKDRD